MIEKQFPYAPTLEAIVVAYRAEHRRLAALDSSAFAHAVLDLVGHMSFAQDGDSGIKGLGTLPAEGSLPAAVCLNLMASEESCARASGRCSAQGHPSPER